MGMLFMHHLSQFLCVIPLNLFFSNEVLYHEIVFNLQFGGALPGFVNNLAGTYDMSIPAENRKVKILRLLSFGIAFYCRTWRWFIGSYGLLSVIHERGEPFTGFYACAVAAVSLLNIFFQSLFVKMLQRDVFSPRKPNPEL